MKNNKRLVDFFTELEDPSAKLEHSKRIRASKSGKINIKKPKLDW